MIGIYKITNKLNGKSYIGQSIHCGKRLDEHCKGDQLVDKAIQLDGIENFTFEILKETNKSELSFWEDYFILKYGTMYPDGYNKKWNTSEDMRNNILAALNKEMGYKEDIVEDVVEKKKSNDVALQDTELKQINFVVGEDKLREMAYSDAIYAWLLLHSSYDKDKNYNYIYASSFKFVQIAEEIGKTRQTVSKRFKELLELNDSTKHPDVKGRPLLIEKTNRATGKKYYILPCFKEFQALDSETVMNLFRICTKAPRREELIKTYVWLLRKYENGDRDFSYGEIMDVFGHSRHNEEIYNRYKDIFTTLQGAGLITFTTKLNTKGSDGKFQKTLHVSQVNKCTSADWLDK